MTTATTERSGRCLCGAVRVSIEVSGNAVGACHCATCRRWGGGPLLAVEGRGLRLEGEQHVSVYPSSEWAERGFCGRCGTHLFYRLKSGEVHAVPVGVLEGDSPWVLDHQVFIDSKPAYYAFSNSTTDLTGEQVFAQYGQMPD